MKFQKEYQVFSKSNAESLKSDKILSRKLFSTFKETKQNKKERSLCSPCWSATHCCICLYLMLRLKAIHLLNYFSMDRSAYCLIYLNNKPNTLTNNVMLASDLSNIKPLHPHFSGQQTFCTASSTMSFLKLAIWALWIIFFRPWLAVGLSAGIGGPAQPWQSAQVWPI